MLSPVKKRHAQSSLRKRNGVLAIALAFCLPAGPSAIASAQLPKPPAPPPAKAESTDPLHRETPRSALEAFLRHEGRGDFATAARFLQAPPGEEAALPEIAREVRALHGRARVDMALVSDDPNGAVEAGLPPGQVRAGVFQVGSTSADVILVRVDDPAYGKIWLVSSDTVAKIPGLYAQMQAEGPTMAERIVPATLMRHYLLSMSLAQWIGWIIFIPGLWG